MLQGKEPKIGKPGSIRMAENTTNSTFVFGAISCYRVHFLSDTQRVGLSLKGVNIPVF
jgi:hypothetical protein